MSKPIIPTTPLFTNGWVNDETKLSATNLNEMLSSIKAILEYIDAVDGLKETIWIEAFAKSTKTLQIGDPLIVPDAAQLITDANVQTIAETLKGYTDTLATYINSGDMNTRIREQALVAANNMLEQYNALLLEFNTLKTFVNEFLESETLAIFDTEGYQILDTTRIPILYTKAETLAIFDTEGYQILDTTRIPILYTKAIL